MNQEISLEEYKRIYREVTKEEKRKEFLIHFIVYLLVNAVFIVINFVYSPEKIWFFYPLVGWGFGLLMHYLFDVRWIEKELRKKEAETEYKVRGK